MNFFEDVINGQASFLTFKIYFIYSLPLDDLTEELGYRCIQNIRYIDQIYDSKKFFTLIGEQVIKKWNSPLRENFIEVIPEIIMDHNMHSG